MAVVFPKISDSVPIGSLVLIYVYIYTYVVEYISFFEKTSREELSKRKNVEN